MLVFSLFSKMFLLDSAEFLRFANSGDSRIQKVWGVLRGQGKNRGDIYDLQTVAILEFKKCGGYCGAKEKIGGTT